MIRWQRLVLPPWWAVALAGAIYFSLEVFCLVVEWRLRAPFYSMDVDGLFLHLMKVLAVTYAVFRVWAFHPALRPAYFRWLSQTPWTEKKPLPLGPIHLVWQDVLLVSIAVGLCWPRTGIDSLAAVNVFIACYLAILGFAHAFTGQKAWAYPIAFVLGLMIFLARSPLFYLFGVLAYIIALLGLRASLARFPWHEVPHFQPRFWSATDWKSVGWPFGRLGTGRSNQLALNDVILIGLLFGWLVFVVAFNLGIYDPFIVIPFIIIGAMFRTLFYCVGYASPLSLAGRIALGRLIIPGYDKVFIAPLLTLVVLAVTNTTSLGSGINHLIAVSIGLTVSLWILLGMGPSLDSWRLTGNHRIVKGIV